jgi:aromatic-L-amino-acid decarboxylase
LGTDAIKNRLRHHINLAEKVETWIRNDERLELVYPRALNIMTFRIKTSIDPDGRITKQLSEAINQSGKTYMTHTVVEGRNLIRWVTGQTYTEKRHIENAWTLIHSLLDKILV